MPSVNTVLLIGHLGQDPELSQLPSGDAVANFSLATSEKWKAKDGTPKELTEWSRIVVYGPSAENYVGPYLHKGDLCMVRGKLRTRSWETSSNEKRYSTEIIADRFGGVQGLGGGKDRSESSPAAPHGADGGQSVPRQGGGAPKPQRKPSGGGDFNDDIVFLPYGKEHNFQP